MSTPAKLLETRASLKEAELTRCVVDLVQANERLTVQMSNLQEKLHFARQECVETKQRVVTLEQEKSDSRMSSLEESPKSLQLACQDRDELKQRVLTVEQEKSDFLMELSSLEGLAAQMTSIQEALQLASQERNELKQRFITVEQEKSDILMGLSNLGEKCAQLHSDLSDGNANCESSIAGLKEQVGLRTTQGPVVQPVTQYVWKRSGDVCVTGVCYTELLECPPLTSGVHKWSIFVEDYAFDYDCYCLGVASTVHSLKKNCRLCNQEGGWGNYNDGESIHNNILVKGNLPIFRKESKVTFILDLTGEGTLSASVDFKSFHQLFSDMLSVVRIVNPEGGFVPAVSLEDSTTRVRFLGFESVSA